MNESKGEETSRMLEDLRMGLEYLDNEEENLLILKTHLSKIQKIREDQIRKDSIVEVLHERVAALERDIAAANRQSADVQEILTERISFLEGCVKDRDALELNHEELQREHESLNARHSLVVADLKEEHERVLEVQQLCEEKEQEIARVRAAAYADRQTVAQLQLLFETFKKELMSKEQQLSSKKQMHSEQLRDLNNALAVTNAAVEDLSEQLRNADDIKRHLTEALKLSEESYVGAKKDLGNYEKELGLWKGMYAELEAVVLKIKGQLLLVEQSHTRDAAHLAKELETHRTASAQWKAGLTEVQAVLASVAQDMRMIHVLDRQHRAEATAGGGNGRMQNAQIMALAISMQKSVAPSPAHKYDHMLGKSNHPTPAAPTASTAAAPHSGPEAVHVQGARTDIAAIVQSSCDLIYRIFAQEEEGSGLKQEIRLREESANVSVAYSRRVEAAAADANEELRRADEVLRLLCEYFTQGQLELFKASELDLLSESGLAGSSEDWEEEVIEASLEHRRRTPIASTGLKEAIHALKSEARAAQLDSFLYVLHKSLQSTESLELEKARLVRSHRAALSRQAWEVSKLAAAHERRESQLEAEIAELRNLNEEATIAVRFTEFESQNEIKRVRSDAERRAKESVRGNTAEVEELRVLVNTYQTKYSQVTLCLEHALAHIAPLRRRYVALQGVYQLSVALYHQLSQSHHHTLREVQALVHACVDHTDGSGNTGAAAATASSSSPSHHGHGRPEASSRRQRSSKYRLTEHHALVRAHRSLRVVALAILAVNRLRRFNNDRRKEAFHPSNLLAVTAATTAAAPGMGGASPAKRARDQDEFVLYYPAFALPSMRLLTHSDAEEVTEQLLLAADCIPFPSFEDSRNYSSLLQDIKLRHASPYAAALYSDSGSFIDGPHELRKVFQHIQRLNRKLLMLPRHYTSPVHDSTASLHIIPGYSSAPVSPSSPAYRPSAAAAGGYKSADVTPTSGAAHRYGGLTDVSISAVVDEQQDLEVSRTSEAIRTIQASYLSFQSRLSDDGSDSDGIAEDNGSGSDAETAERRSAPAVRATVPSSAHHYASAYPVFNDTSDDASLNNTTHNEMLEIYSDIGRLTGKLRGDRFSATM